jgi:hypothetical protein
MEVRVRQDLIRVSRRSYDQRPSEFGGQSRVLDIPRRIRRSDHRQL